MGLTDCNRMRERISLKLDGELSPHESSLLERHLLGCPACAAFAVDASRYTELLRSAPIEQPPVFVLPRRRGALRLSAGMGAAIASAAAAALVAISTLSLSSPSEDPPQAAGFSFVPSAAFVERARDGVVGLRHPSPALLAVRPAPRPALGLQDATRHGVFGP